MVVRHHVSTYDEFCKLIKELESKKCKVFVLFSGSTDSTGKSWCPDCVVAEPVIEQVLKSVDDTSHFVHVGIERTIWKDPNNQFRKDDRLKLTCVPTLVQWGEAVKLGDSQCANKGLVELLFEGN